MKKVKFLILAFICFMQVHAQEPQNTWSLNAIVSHYDRIKENELNLGEIGFNINPGLEVLYNYQPQNKLSLSIGVSYQFVNLISHVEASDKFQVGELSIPFLITVKSKSGPLSLSTGIYAGQFLHFDWYHQLHNQWETVNAKEREFYSDNDFFMDAYLDFAYSHKGLRIAPFIRYRFKDNWMEHYRTNVYYGIKFGINYLNRND